MSGPEASAKVLSEARSVSDGWAPRRSRSGLGPVGVWIRARSVSDGGAHPSLTLRALTKPSLMLLRFGPGQSDPYRQSEPST